MIPRQLVVILGTSLILASGACKTEKSKVEPPSPIQPSAQGAPTPAAPVAAPAPAAEEEAVADFAADPHEHMKAHFVRALKLQDAVLAVNLSAAKVQGRWLATHDSSDAPEGWRPYLKTFQAEAKVVADATSVADAAVAVSHIAAACGDCHVANHAKPKMGGVPLFKKAASVKDHMADQIEALYKLWTGLVIPSDQAWREGAALLAKVAVTQKALTKEGLDKADSTKILAETLQTLSAKAGQAAKADRAQTYADLLTTCVACHTAVRTPVAATPPAPVAGH
jgi:hypothetical protein